MMRPLMVIVRRIATKVNTADGSAITHPAVRSVAIVGRRDFSPCQMPTTATAARSMTKVTTTTS